MGPSANAEMEYQQHKWAQLNINWISNVDHERQWLRANIKQSYQYSETRLLRTLKGNEKRNVLNKVQTKKRQKSPIGDVRDRRRERYNRVYVLSRVRTNRVSLWTEQKKKLYIQQPCPLSAHVKKILKKKILRWNPILERFRQTLSSDFTSQLYGWEKKWRELSCKVHS